MSSKDITDQVMERIEKERIAMRPRWHFTFLAILSTISVILLSAATIYLVNVLTFKIRIETSDAPMYGARQRLDYMTANFPWWLLILALVSLAALVWLLRRRSSIYRWRTAWIVTAAVALSLIFGILLAQTPINNWQHGQSKPTQNMQNHGGQYRGKQHQM